MKCLALCLAMAGTSGFGQAPAKVVCITASEALTNMVLIPAGSFTMGDSLDGDHGALHTNQISAFYMDRHEVTTALWDEVYQWATNRPSGLRYRFEHGAQGKAANHPAQSMTWYDAVKWCNARSEKEGRTPAYYRSVEQTNVYRSGQPNVQNEWVKWNRGYRLPTEAEWEKAARGGLSEQRFPWILTNITHRLANYNSSTSDSYGTTATLGFHLEFNDGVCPYTSPVGYFAANGYGLYDMAGNVGEWCWDWGGAYRSGAQTDPRGPTLGSDRVLRGGSWLYSAGYCRSASRFNYYPTDGDYFIGFRCVLPPGQEQ